MDRKQSAVRTSARSEILEGRPLKRLYVTVLFYEISAVGIRNLVLRNRKTEFAREIQPVPGSTTEPHNQTLKTLQLIQNTASSALRNVLHPSATPGYISDMLHSNKSLLLLTELKQRLTIKKNVNAHL